jgi:ParB-like chromosome segregation protein Spo0J
MATVPANDVLEANDLETIVSVRVDQIEMGERLRPVDPLWAEALGKIMAREGQQMPIEVCKLPGRQVWTLVTGGHRLEGARLIGIDYLKAIIVGADRTERRMREVSENLWRRGLDPIDRAAFIAEAHSLLRVRAGLGEHQTAQQIAAQARWQKTLKDAAGDASATIAGAYGIDAQLGDQLGLSERTVRNDLLIYRRIPASLIQQLRDARHPVASNATQLRALAKLDAREQRDIVVLLIQFAKSVGEARATLSQKPKPAAEDKRLSAFIGAFHRMSLTEKKGALAHLSGQLPAGFRIAENDPSAEPSKAQLRSALSQAFDVIAKLFMGEPVEDDQIAAAHRAARKSLFDTWEASK